MPRPNLLVIHTDQQSAWTLSCYGDGPVATPHIDRLAVEGALFEQFFTNSAVCTPSRGCFLTGRYPHAHGAYRNNLALHRDERTWAHQLQAAGYETGYAGKWHLDGTPRPGWVHPERTMGFEQAQCMFNRGHWKKIVGDGAQDMQPMVSPYGEIGDARTYTTDWLTQRTLEFLRAPRQRPFAFMVSFPDPHTPFTVRAPYDTRFDPAAMALPASLAEQERPDWAREAAAGVSAAPPPDQLRALKAQYCGQVQLIDDCVGRLLQELADQGVLDHTVVVFTTDHGEYMGEHGLMHKNQLYETAYRIPLLIRWPAAIPAGTRVRHIFSTVDFQPTLLQLLDVEPAGREQGHSGAALVRGESSAWDDASYLHHSSLRRAGISTPEYALAYVAGGQPILFDRRRDPAQLHNLFGTSEHAGAVAELTGRILAHHAAWGSPALAWLEDDPVVAAARRP